MDSQIEEVVNLIQSGDYGHRSRVIQIMDQMATTFRPAHSLGYAFADVSQEVFSYLADDFGRDPSQKIEDFKYIKSAGTILVAQMIEYIVWKHNTELFTRMVLDPFFARFAHSQFVHARLALDDDFIKVLYRICPTGQLRIDPYYLFLGCVYWRSATSLKRVLKEHRTYFIGQLQDIIHIIQTESHTFVCAHYGFPIDENVWRTEAMSVIREIFGI